MELKTHKCAFCKGTGGVRRFSLSSPTVCPVCSRRGEIYVVEPVTPCAFCKGTGEQPNCFPGTLTCAACGGGGVATLKEPSGICSDCSGTGGPFSRLYCLTCRGTGRVEAGKSVFVGK